MDRPFSIDACQAFYSRGQTIKSCFLFKMLFHELGIKMKTLVCLLLVIAPATCLGQSGPDGSLNHRNALLSETWTVATNDIWGAAQTDQEKCQAEAEYMAANRAFYHVGPCIGRFEGIGWSRSGGSPSTCTPRSRMQLTGDATSLCADGTVVRVRSWR